MSTDTTSIGVKTEAAATAPEWDRHVNGCRYATYFHSRGWAEIWQGQFQGRLALRPRLLSFTDGATAVLPLAELTEYRGIVRTHLSSVGLTYGGWVSAEELSNEHARLLESYLLRQRNLYWRINPYVGVTSEALSARANADVTHTLSLDGGLTAVTRGMSKGHRAAVRQAERSGIAVRCARDPSDWEAYYLVYRDSIRRWGDSAGSIHPPTLFERFSEQDKMSIRLWLATHDSTVVAGALCLYQNEHVSYWHGAALEAAFPLRPVHYLIYEAIRDAIERQYRWFDFNPSGDNPGVAAFKRHFGASSLPSPVVVANSPQAALLYAVDAPRRILARRRRLRL